MLLMGNVTEGAAPAETGGTEPITPTAEPGAETAVVATETDTGTEPVTTTAEPSGVVEGGEPEGGGRQPHQKTLDERVAELVAQKEPELEQRLIAKLQETTQAKTLDFIPDIDFGKVNTYIADMLAAIDKAQLDGEGWKALELQDELAEVRKNIKLNEEKKAAYMEAQKADTQTAQQREQLNAQIAEASKLVASEFKIPEDVWKKGEQFFEAERRAKPILDAQYREKVIMLGPVSAMLWAKEYVEQNMGKKEAELIQQKEQAKETLPAGKTAVGVVNDATAAKLAALRKAAESGNPSDIAAYSQFKRESTQPT